MSAFSLIRTPLLLTVQLQGPDYALLPRLRVRGFGIRFDRQSFSAQSRLMSQLLRTV